MNNARNLIATLLLTMPYVLCAQGAKTIRLKPNKNLYKPRNYHVSKVVDDRTDTTSIGTMRAGIAQKTVPLQIEGGVASAIYHFINNSIRQNVSADALEMHITQLNVSEKNADLRQQADVAFGVAFYQNGNKLIEYTGSSYAQTGFDASAYIEKLIKNSIERSLKDFDNWYTKAEGNAGVLATVNFMRVADDKDLILYNKERKLSLNDFKGEPDDMSKGSAATYSGIGMKYSHERTGRTVKLDVSLYVYFDKSKSWCKEVGKSAKTLNHEQLHFDITALNACRLAEKIKAYNFSIENYSAELEALLKEADKEGTQLQNDYDKESTHGIRQDIQQQWDEDIRSKLADTNCY
jgi:hypothetical protein